VSFRFVGGPSRLDRRRGWASDLEREAREYARVREERREAGAARREAGAARAPAAASGNGATRRVGPSKNEQRRIAELEREVERAETALKQLEDEQADPAMWSSPSRTERNTARHEKAKRAVEQAYARWEEASGSA
jgi:ABC transporter C-terminal domain